MNDRFCGSVTVFAALSFMLVVSLILALTESVRVQGAGLMVSMAAEEALDALFSNYERELLDCYGALLFDGADGGDALDTDMLERRIQESLECNLATSWGVVKGHDFYDISIDDIAVSQVVTATDACGLVWRGMINDYAKLDYSAELLESILAIEKQDEKHKKIQEAGNYVNRCYDTAAGIEVEYLKLIECVDGIKTENGGINFAKLKTHNCYLKKIVTSEEAVTYESISINNETVFNVVAGNVFNIKECIDKYIAQLNFELSKDSPNIDYILETSGFICNILCTVRDETSHCMDIIDNIRRGNGIMADRIERATAYIASEADLDEEYILDLKNEILGLNSYRASFDERYKDLDGMYAVLAENYELVEAAVSLCKNLLLEKEKNRNFMDEIVSYREGYEKAAELIVNYRTDGMYINYEGLECAEEDGSILGCVYDYVADGIIGMVLPEGTEISSKNIQDIVLADSYAVRGNRKEYIDEKLDNLMNEALFTLYIGNTFGCYTDCGGEGLLDYETEYILFGGKSDRENLIKAITAIAGIRLGANLAFVYTNGAKKNEAYAVAATALGFTGIIPLIKGLQYVILTAWAIGETIVDLKILTAGGKVPLIKRSNEWYLSLDNLLKGNLKIDDGENKKGLDYKGYLSCMLFLSDGQDKAYRSMALVEAHMISAGVDNFRLKNYVYGVSICVTYHLGNQKKQYTRRCSYTY